MKASDYYSDSNYSNNSEVWLLIFSLSKIRKFFLMFQCLRASLDLDLIARLPWERWVLIDEEANWEIVIGTWDEIEKWVERDDKICIIWV